MSRIKCTNCRVMAGLVPAIHVFLSGSGVRVDARDKHGHDGLRKNAHSRRRSFSTLTLLTLVGFCVALPLLAATPAAADLRFCNRTKSRVGVAIGYRDKDGWSTEGWFNLGPSLCETLLRGPLTSRYYYFYAIDYDVGGEWGGKAFMCTQDKMFTIRGVERCSERGFERTGFIEVDTGEQKSWTVQLTEPGDRGGATQ